MAERSFKLNISSHHTAIAKQDDKTNMVILKIKDCLPKGFGGFHLPYLICIYGKKLEMLKLAMEILLTRGFDCHCGVAKDGKLETVDPAVVLPVTETGRQPKK